MSRRRSRSERGSLLVALMVAIAVMGILTGIAVQLWSDVKRREDEAEMIFRAREIVRAILLYRRDRGTLPTELKQLLEPGSRGQYFLRQNYKDPLVRGGKWGLLYAGPAGNVYDPDSSAAAEPSLLPGGPVPAQDNPGGRMTLGEGPAGGQEVGGLPIVGVKTLCKDKPFRVLDDKTNYSEWQFHIFQLEAAPGQGAPGQPGRPGQPGQPGGGGGPGVRRGGVGGN